MSHGLLIVGGGLAAQRCCETLRALGHDGPITIAGAEGTEPYDRPPLSKEGLADAAIDPRGRPRDWYAEHGVELRLGAPAVRLRAAARTVELAGGERLRYRREGRITAVLLAGRSAADLRAARRLLIPEPELDRSAS